MASEKGCRKLVSELDFHFTAAGSRLVDTVDDGLVVQDLGGRNRCGTVCLDGIQEGADLLVEQTCALVFQNRNHGVESLTGDVGYAIEKVALEAGFGVVRDWIGHGVGRTVHEDPQVPNYGKPGTKLVLKPGMTLAIEPMISMTKKGEKTYVLDDDWTVVTADNCLSAHFEHTVAITDDGCEILTLPADYP